VAEACGRMAGSVLVRGIGLLEGEVCKASTAVDSSNLTRRTTLAAGSYHSVRSAVGFFCCRYLLWQGVGLDDPQRSLPTPNIL